MSDLIRKIDVLKLIDNISHVNYKDSDVYFLRQKILEMPDAFDLDKVIAELKDKQDLFAEESKTDAHAEKIRNEFRGQSFAYGESIKIIKKHLSDNAEPPKTD